MHEIKSIKFERNNKVFYISIDDKINVSYQGKERIVTDNNFLRYIEYLSMIISEWKKEYINNNLIDGEYWSLLIIFENDAKKEYSGKGDYPDNFEMIDIINQKLIGGDL